MYEPILHKDNELIMLHVTLSFVDYITSINDSYLLHFGIFCYFRVR